MDLSAPTQSHIPPTVPENTSESFQRPRPPGNRKCDSDNCVTCDLMLTGNTFKSTMTGKEYKFMPSVSCHTKIIIYLVSYTFSLVFHVNANKRINCEIE